MRKLLLTLTLALAGLLPSAHAQQQVPIVGGVVTVNTSQANYFKVYVTSAITSVVLTPSPNLPRQITVLFSQDAIGHTVTFSQCSVSATANVVTACPLLYDATVNAWVAATPAPSGSPTGAAGGALSGTYPNPSLSSVYALPSGTDSGAANAYVVNPSPAVTLTFGQSFTFTTTHPNTGASTINVSGTGVKNLRTVKNAAFTGGEIADTTGTQVYQATYDGSEWLLAGTDAAGSAANPAGSLQLSGAYVVGVPTVGDGTTSAGLTFLTTPGNSGVDDRQMMNFLCVPSGGSGCGGTTNSMASFGFDHDNVFLFSGNVMTYGFSGNVEHFGALNLFTQGTGDNLTLEQNNTPLAGSDAIRVNAPSTTTKLFEVDATGGNITSEAAGAASFPAIQWTGTPFSGGTGTTTFPYIYYNCAGSTQPTNLSTSGTIIGINTCSGYSGNYLYITANGNSTPTLQLYNSGLNLNNAIFTTTQAINLNGSAALFKFNGKLTISPVNPTISSGFGTGASVSAGNGTVAFRINVGTSNTGNGVIGLPTASTGWNCFATDLTTTSTTVSQTKQTASTTTTATLQNYTDVSATGAWVDNDILAVSCFAY